jgi:hypothetical protein
MPRRGTLTVSSAGTACRSPAPVKASAQKPSRKPKPGMSTMEEADKLKC